MSDEKEIKQLKTLLDPLIEQWFLDKCDPFDPVVMSARMDNTIKLENLHKDMITYMNKNIDSE